MNINDALDLARYQVEGGMKIEITPILKNSDCIEANITIQDISYLEDRHIKELISLKEKYKCKFVIRNNKVVFS